MAMAFLCFQMLSANAQSRNDLPHLDKDDNGKYTFYVDGEPFVILGAQLWNSSAWPDVFSNVWPQMKELNCNTLEVPIYWQNIEPEPGKFNFKELDELVTQARSEGFRLVLLWFGSYKNGRMQYAPEWVLNNPEEYPRMKNEAGADVYVLSAVSEKNRQADQRAFVETMRHLKQIDGDDHTVIMMQVENEPGSMWTDRDYSEAANELFNGPVPSKLTQSLNKSGGTWEEVFGVEAAEAFNAYYIARYIDQIAEAGHREYGLPMYTNVWIRENAFQRPGEYPSGGPTSNMLGVWKASAPNIELLALDIYHRNYTMVNELFDTYARDDNPLFVPEMGNGPDFARYQFYALGNYDAIGVAPYGIDPFHVDPHDKRDKENLDQKFTYIAANYRLLKGAMALLTELQGTGKLKAVGQEHGLGEQLVQFDNYEVLFNYGFPTYKTNNDLSGRAMIGQLGPDEFLLMGFDAKFTFRPHYGSGYGSAEYVIVEEGTFENGEWVRRRIWNGDALYHSTLPSDGVILKIKLRRTETASTAEGKANFDKK
ncbi:MAG: DUF5597 domain-containing protein [Cyclobacteriaceae bacterium]